MMKWTQGVHHDGSELYVSNLYPAFNETVEIRLRVPKSAPLKEVALRTEPDGEQNFAPMIPYQEDELSIWYKADLFMRNRRMFYRFVLLTEEVTWYYNGQGISLSESLDLFDFKLLADFRPLPWVHKSVFYQIFPDRFYNGDPSVNPEHGKVVTFPGRDNLTHSYPIHVHDWDDTPLEFAEGGNIDFFGGDLSGIRQKLDYLQELGFTALYLNPIFTSHSNHKYNVADFYNVDPHFGGNQALIDLRQALDQANMRLILDMTPNHAGDDHPWFQEAQANPESDKNDLFKFYEHPHDYECWLGVKTLPKFNYANQATRDAVYGNEDSILKHWLKEPYRIDGWRLDVWNMTARRADEEYSREVSREIRQELKQLNPNAYVFGENFFDASPGLQGDEFDGNMNYRGFSFPVWRWIAYQQDRPDRKKLPAEVSAQQMQHFLSAIPWAIARMQFNQLGSHDTPRILSLLQGDTAKLSATLLMTFPGVPCIYYGDEIGLYEHYRQPMQWDRDKWNHDLFEHHQKLIQLRRTSHALSEGGFQILHAEGDLLVYQRQSSQEQLIIVGYRGQEPLDNVSIPVAHGNISDSANVTDLLSGQSFSVLDGNLKVDLLPAGANLILKIT